MIESQQIVAFLRTLFPALEVSGQPGRMVSQPSSITKAVPDGLAFYKRKRWDTTPPLVDRLAIILTDEEGAKSLNLSPNGPLVIILNNPRLAFIETTRHFFQQAPVAGVHPTACIDPTAEVHPTVKLGPFVFVGKEVIIGAHTVIEGHTFIYDRTTIGERCYLAPGVKIGQPGFGYERNNDGELVQFPHIGRVIIENDVHIGANTAIDRGTLDDTHIRSRARIDNLCHISHNVDIGPDTAVIANTMIGGSVVIGEKSWLAPCVSIINGVSIGAGATIGMAAVVTKPVEAGTVVLGSPAKPIEEYKQEQRRLRILLE